MKRKTIEPKYTFPKAVLYLDDIYDIVMKLNSFADKVEVSVGEYTIDDIDELDKLAGQFAIHDEFPNLEIAALKLDKFRTERNGENTYEKIISLSISKDFVSLNTYYGTNKAEIDSIENTLIKIFDLRKKKINFIYIFNIITIVFSFYIIIKYKDIKAGITLILLFFLLSLLLDTFIKKYAVKTYKRGNKQSFFQRHKDSLIINLIVAIISSLITGALTKYLH